MSVRRLLVIVAIVLVLCAALLGWWLFHGHRMTTADSRILAQAETRMWKSYYDGDQQALGKELVTLLRTQFGLSLPTSLLVGRDLALAAGAFAQRQGNYEVRVLPSLVRAYTQIHDATGGKWDPDAVAKAELDWWVARRTPGRSDPESVGAAIAYEYELLYGATNPDIAQAGLLRAQAGALRDQGGKNADWGKVQSLLEASYTALLRGVTEK